MGTTQMSRQRATPKDDEVSGVARFEDMRRAYLIGNLELWS